MQGAGKAASLGGGLTRWCDKSIRAISALVDRLLCSQGTDADILHFLQQLGALLGAASVRFIGSSSSSPECRLPDRCLAWPAADAQPLDEPPPELLEVLASDRWHEARERGECLQVGIKPAGGATMAAAPGQVLLIPVVCCGQGGGCLAIGGRCSGRGWPSVERELARTAALLLGTVFSRSRVDEQLRNVCDRFNLAGELSGVGVWDWNIESGELWWSEAIAPMFGLPPHEQPTYAGFLELVHPEDRAGLEQAVKASLAGDTPYRFDHRVLLADGRVRWMREQGSTLRAEDGHPTRMIGVVQDITDSKRTERMLMDSHRLLQQFGDSVRDVIYIRDICPPRLVFINKAYETLFGDSVDRLREDPRRFLRLLHPADLDRVRAAMRRVEGGEPVRLEYRIIRPDDSERWVEVNAFPVRDEEGRIYRVAGLVEDITERKCEEQQRREAERQQRDALVREVHHRIKNSLQGIVGLTRQEFEAYPTLKEVGENMLGKIRSIAIVHGLQSRGSQEGIYLCEIVDAITNAARNVLGQAIELHLDMEVEAPLRVHPAETVPLALVINELITNAVKHGSGAGTRDVHVCFTASGDLGVVRISNVAPDPSLDINLSGGTGLQLVRALLPRRGASLDIRVQHDTGHVVAELVLERPVVSAEKGQSQRPPPTRQTDNMKFSQQRLEVCHGKDQTADRGG